MYLSLIVYKAIYLSWSNFFWWCLGFKPRPYIYYTLSLPTEINSQGYLDPTLHYHKTFPLKIKKYSTKNQHLASCDTKSIVALPRNLEIDNDTNMNISFLSYRDFVDFIFAIVLN